MIPITQNIKVVQENKDKLNSIILPRLKALEIFKKCFDVKQHKQKKVDKDKEIIKDDKPSDPEI